MNPNHTVTVNIGDTQIQYLTINDNDYEYDRESRNE